MRAEEVYLENRIEYVEGFAKRSKTECKDMINKCIQNIEELFGEIEELDKKVKKLSKSMKRLNTRVEQLDEQLNKDNKKANTNYANNEESEIEFSSINEDELSKLVKKFVQIVKDC